VRPSSDHESYLPREVKRLAELGLEHPELHQRGLENLEKGAEVLRRHKGWSRQELAQHLELPPDFAGLKPAGKQHLGQRIVELREIVGITPGQLAARSQVSINLILLLEERDDEANPDWEQLKKIARALDTNLTFLVYWAELLAGGEP
jgi:ribosome-binding protein aMBF1 (putative translation factor)